VLKTSPLRYLSAGLTIVLSLVMHAPQAMACPFCSAVSQTLTEQITTNDAAVLAELIDLPPKLADGPEAPVFEEAIEASKATFRIIEVYRGEEELGDTKEFKALYLSEKQPGERFLILGRKQLSFDNDQPELEWGAPIWLSEKAQEYLAKVIALPAGKEHKAERLAFFEDYLQAEESLLRADAFDEFARADYDTLKAIKDKIDRPRLLEWIKDPEVTRSHRRLYFTMLGVCGTEEDVKLLEGMLLSGNENDWQALDALVACYLTLNGEKGMSLIEEQFLKKKDLDYVPLFAVIMALRFQGEQADIIPRSRIVEAMRLVLERSDLADLVITDLARWKDWESKDRLAQLFREVEEEAFFIRMAVVKYMRVCPLPEAKQYLKEFNEIDPKVVARASSAWPGLTPVKPKSETKRSSPNEDFSPPTTSDATAAKAPATEESTAATATQPAKKTAATEGSSEAEKTTAAALPATGGKDAEGGETPLRIAILAGVIVSAVILLFAFWMILGRRREPTV